MTRPVSRLFPDLTPSEKWAREISLAALRHYVAGVPFFAGCCTCTGALRAGSTFFGNAPTTKCPFCGQPVLLDLILPIKGTPGDLWTDPELKLSAICRATTVAGIPCGASE